MTWKISTSKELAEAGRSISSGVKKAVLLNGGWEEDYATGVVVIDHVTGKGEVHDRMRDVWYILDVEGTGRFHLGGKMQDPQLARAGEWTAEGLIGAETVEVKPGDVIDIPAGIPHQTDAAEGRVVALIVKVPA